MMFAYATEVRNGIRSVPGAAPRHPLNPCCHLAGLDMVVWQVECMLSTNAYGTL